MSFNIITNLLKNKMSYNGLIMIDSVRMKALTGNYLEKEIVNGFFLAGGDLFLDPLNPIQCLEYIDKISRENLEYFQGKIKKVLNFKSKFRLYE
jgi:beta-N-acetylhexosaminidase